MPVVLLVHERARIGTVMNAAAEGATSTEDLLLLAERSTAKLGAGQRAAIEKIIRDDHRHNERRARRVRA